MGNWSTKRGEGKGIKFLRGLIGTRRQDCVLWPYSRNPISNYGYMGFNGKVWRAHQLMCTLAHGARPMGKEASHSCHKPACVNPNHLSWRTHSENILDKGANGTHKAGKYGQHGKLSDDEVRTVRSLAGKKTQVEIGKLVGLSESAIRAICKRKTYTHVE